MEGSQKHLLDTCYSRDKMDVGHVVYTSFQDKNSSGLLRTDIKDPLALFGRPDVTSTGTRYELLLFVQPHDLFWFRNEVFFIKVSLVTL